MTQVLLHDYGKGRFSLKEIRAAIKAVKAEKFISADAGETVIGKTAKKPKA